jgi:SAM-dependent methyltransferase
VKSGGPVLELGSGTGRIMIPIARAGIRISGIDLSDRMIGILKNKLKQEQKKTVMNIDIVKSDFRRFDLGRRYPLVIIPFSTFQYLLEVDDQLSCLESCAAHLDDGGTFVLSVFNESISRLSDKTLYEEFDITPEFEMPDGRRVYRRFRYVERDYTKQVEIKESIFYVSYPDGRSERLVHKFGMRYFFQFELIHLCSRAGFNVKSVYSDYKYKPFDAAFREGRLIIIAEKQGSPGK